MKVGIIGSTGYIGKSVYSDCSLKFRFDATKHEIKSELQANTISTVLHFAGNSVANQYSKLDLESELKFITNLIESMSVTNNSHLILASTAHVYGNIETGKPAVENQAPNPTTFYGESKLIIENTAMEASKKCGVKITILRIFSIFDRGMSSHFLAGKIEKYLNKNDSIVIINSNDIRDFSRLDQVSDKINSVVRAKLKLDDASIFNICTGIGITVKEKCLQDYGSGVNFQFPSDSLNSNIPYLVGNPQKFNEQFENSNRIIINLEGNLSDNEK